ncbi:MAG TPA: glycosyltransferase [Rhodanobacteraceae bacterium]|jgi:glycosyltransferase involved in cell wall biosynthesis|nr:glycosyltransferase [Rhodanobacteraceae bacterium]
MSASESGAMMANLRGATAHRDGPLRILFLIRSFGRGGAQRQLVTLATALHRAGWDVAVACFYAGDVFQRELVQASVPVIDLRKRGRWDAAGFLWRLWRTLRAHDADIVHGYLTVGNLLALLAKLAHRRTRVVWGVRSAYMDRARYDRMARLTFRFSCLFARFADLIIVNSDAGAAHHAALGYPRARIRVIPNGIDTRYFRFDDDARARVRREWRIPDDALLVGLVGRLDPMKDHPTFLAAAARLAARDPHWRFVCVGEGKPEDAAALHAQANELGLARRLLWASPRGDMPAVYSALDLLASTSYGESFPNVIAEAMACGRPCVVTDVGDCARIVGTCGAVVAPRDADAFAMAVESMLPTLADAEAVRAMHAAARQRIVEAYSLEALLGNSKAALAAVCADRRYT